MFWRLVFAGIFSLPLASAQENLNGFLSERIQSGRLPAAGAAVVRQGKIVALGVAGTRRAGQVIPVTRSDRWHLGSDTKAFTALLAATFVEAKQLRWDSTIGEVFPPRSNGPLPSDAITLQQLLSHTSGSDDTKLMELIAAADREDANLDGQRAELVESWRPQPLVAKPGEKYKYANINYIVAGAMLERISRRTWEELMIERVLTPLELSSGGFGPTSSLGRVDSPLGHQESLLWRTPMLAGPAADNRMVLGPAGTMHMNLDDFARWAGWNAGQGKRGPQLVSAETLRKLQTPVVEILPVKGAATGRYALGWAEFTPKWSPRPLLHHAGSNTLNLAHIWVDPVDDYAMVLVTNIGGAFAEKSLQGIARELYQKYPPK
jgi:CubicO group peptidase (beta-lactamase class C family)